HLGALGVVHAEEKDVAPAAVREVHAHGRTLSKNRVTAVAARPEKLGPKAQRLVGGMAHAEHPLVAADRAHAAAHLIGQRLEGQPMIRRGEGAAERIVWALA